MHPNKALTTPRENAALVELLLHHYALTPPITFFPTDSGSNNLVIGVRSQNSEYVLKTIVAPHNRAAMYHEQQLLHWLTTQLLPFAVPAPVPTGSGELLVQTGESYYRLTPRLPGEQPAWRDGAQMQLLGAALGALHPVLAGYPHLAACETVPYGALERIHPLLADPYHLMPQHLQLPSTSQTEETFRWWRSELAALRAFIDGPYRTLPRQLIHGDFLPSNTLYVADADRGHIAAILDFEFAGVDARAMDLASALYFCMRIWENPEPLRNGAAFCRGYAQRGALTSAEITAIPWLMRLRNAASALWWFGRQLATGATVDYATRIAGLQQLVRWLAGAEGRRLQVILQEEFRHSVV
ncbi:MAG TPA: phosphotransferase [Caldilineaceae bacterium]|nr:phosphotransferase [Caldilineaceae bacterium]